MKYSASERVGVVLVAVGLLVLLYMIAGCSAPTGYVRAGKNSDERWVSQGLVSLPMAPTAAAAISRASPIGLSASRKVPRIELFADGLAADDLAGRTIGIVEGRAFAPLLDMGPVTLEAFAYWQSRHWGIEAHESTALGLQIKF